MSWAMRGPHCPVPSSIEDVAGNAAQPNSDNGVAMASEVLWPSCTHGGTIPGAANEMERGRLQRSGVGL